MDSAEVCHEIRHSDIPIFRVPTNRKKSHRFNVNGCRLLSCARHRVAPERAAKRFDVYLQAPGTGMIGMIEVQHTGAECLLHLIDPSCPFLAQNAFSSRSMCLRSVLRNSLC